MNIILITIGSIMIGIILYVLYEEYKSDIKK